jgi:hypothetical protein
VLVAMMILRLVCGSGEAGGKRIGLMAYKNPEPSQKFP